MLIAWLSLHVTYIKIIVMILFGKRYFIFYLFVFPACWADFFFKRPWCKKILGVLNYFQRLK